MKVLVTGGTGFIGSKLALKSQQLGHSVTVLGQVNNSFERENQRLLEARGVAVELAAVTERDRVFRLTEGCDVVFHLAAAQHEANVPDRHFWDVNVEGTRNVLEASIAGGVGRLVHGSTIGVYGSALAGELNEASPLKPDNIYGITKLEGEKLVLSRAAEIPVVAIRISETYGPGDRRLLKLFRAVEKKMFFMIGRGDNKHQLIYVDDLLDGLYLAATSDKAVGQLFVLAGGEIVTTWEMVRTIANALETRVRRLRSPLWPFVGAAVIMEKTLKPFGIQPPLHRRRLDFFRKSFFFSRDRARTVLGFEPATSFHDGVAKTLAWYRENTHL